MGFFFSTVSLHLGFRVYHTTGILWLQCCDKIQYMCRSGWWQSARQSQFQWFRKYMTVDIAILEKIMCKRFLRKHHRLTAHWPISEQCSCNLWNFHFCSGLRQSLLLPHAISTYSCDKQLQLPERVERPYSQVIMHKQLAVLFVLLFVFNVSISIRRSCGASW